MILGNTPRKEVSFFVEASKSFAVGLQFKTVDGAPIDLTGAEVRLVATEPVNLGGVEVMNKLAESTDPLTGFTQFNLQAEDLALDPSNYPYDATLVSQNYSLPILKGFFEVGANTDSDISNIYASVIAPSTITVILDQGQVSEIHVGRTTNG